jgi:hypothetical protein
VSRPRAQQLLSAALASWGAVLLVRPRPVVAAVAPEYPADHDWVVRVLGARQVLQNGVLLATRNPALGRAGAAVDALHALSMLPVTRSPRYGRAALVSGAIAAGSGVLTAVLSRGSSAG